jgi:hypothetical protein
MYLVIEQSRKPLWHLGVRLVGTVGRTLSIHVEIGVTLLQKTNDSSRVNLNRIFNQKTRTTYEPGVVVLTDLQITSLP